MAALLVVEDDPEVHQLLVEFLGELGHRVLAAVSAAAARVVMASETVELLLVDCLMNGEQGTSLAAHCRALGIPAILMTGHPEYADALAEAPFPVLRKPFRLAELQMLVDTVLGKSAG